MHYGASTQILYSVLKSTIASALILLGFGIEGAIVGYILGTFATGIVGASILFTKFARSTARPILLASAIASVPSTALVQLYAAGAGLVDFIAGGGFFVISYLTMAPILGAIIPQDINNLETILFRTRAVAALVKPVLAYEKRVLFFLRSTIA